jgi:GT2 family glycosyltransferase
MSSAVTTVVATRDRWGDLAWSLLRQERPVILVDNGSTDGTPSLVRARFPDVTVIELGRNHGAVARNVGVEAATTPYVAFADDDSWWAPGSLDLAAELLDRHPRLGLLAARVLVGEDERLDPTCAEMAVSPLDSPATMPGRAVLGFVACGAVVRREAFLAAGGFDPVVRFPGEEERLSLDLAAAGWQLAYVEDIIAHHHPSSTRAPGLERRALEQRNELLTAVMRRPWPAVRATVAGKLRGDRAARLGVLRAVPRLPWALVRRRRLPADVERARQLLSAARPEKA